MNTVLRYVFGKGGGGSFLAKALNAKERGDVTEAVLSFARAEEADHFQKKANTTAMQRITVSQTASDSIDLHNLHVDEAMAVFSSTEHAS